MIDNNSFESIKALITILPNLMQDLIKNLLGDSLNYTQQTFVPSSAKRIATQILFILRVFVCDISCPSKELPAQS